MRRGKADALKSRDILECFEQLNKWAFPFHVGEFVPSVEVHDLTEQRHLLDALRDQGFYLADNLLERPASFVSARIRNNAECAMHVAPLHNGNKSGHLP